MYTFNNLLRIIYHTIYTFNHDVIYFVCMQFLITDLDRIIEPLRATCTTKVKANSVKQEFEKQDELKRSAMRAVVALLVIPDAG